MMIYLILAVIGVATVPKFAQWRHGRALRHYRQLPRAADVPAWLWILPGTQRCVVYEPSYVASLAICAGQYIIVALPICIFIGT